MKQQVSFEYEGNAYTAAVERRGDLLIIECEGQRYEVTLTGGAGPAPAVAPSGGGATQPAAPAAPAAAPGPAPAASAPVAPAPVAPAPVAPAPVAPAPSGAAAPGDVVAPMTGTIREVRAAVGAAVTEGQVLFIMEAMKMDLEVPVAVAGSITEVAVQAGDSVVEAQLLARVAAG